MLRKLILLILTDVTRLLSKLAVILQCPPAMCKSTLSSISPQAIDVIAFIIFLPDYDYKIMSHCFCLWSQTAGFKF